MGIFAIALIAIVGTFAVASPFGEKTSGQRGMMDEETHSAVQEAVENNDYETWRFLMEKGLTLERFEQMKERHASMSEMRELKDELREAMANADEDEVLELKAQLQELRPEWAGKGMHKGMNKGGCPFNN